MSADWSISLGLPGLPLCREEGVQETNFSIKTRVAALAISAISLIVGSFLLWQSSSLGTLGKAAGWTILAEGAFVGIVSVFIRRIIKLPIPLSEERKTSNSDEVSSIPSLKKASFDLKEDKPAISAAIGEKYVVTGHAGNICKWSCTDGALLQTIPFTDTVKWHRVAIDEDIVAAAEDKLIHIFSTAGEKPRRLASFETAFTPSSIVVKNGIVAAAASNQLYVYSIHSKKMLHEINTRSPIKQIVIHGDLIGYIYQVPGFDKVETVSIEEGPVGWTKRGITVRIHEDKIFSLDDKQNLSIYSLGDGSHQKTFHITRMLPYFFERIIMKDELLICLAYLTIGTSITVYSTKTNSSQALRFQEKIYDMQVFDKELVICVGPSVNCPPEERKNTEIVKYTIIPS